jgi:predicted HicB family RNase H-like nuclease
MLKTSLFKTFAKDKQPSYKKHLKLKQYEIQGYLHEPACSLANAQKHFKGTHYLRTAGSSRSLKNASNQATQHQIPEYH